MTDVPVCLCSLETEWRKRKASRRGAEEEEEEEDDDSGEEMKALRERQREELSKVASGDPRPPPYVILGFLPTWRLERRDPKLEATSPLRAWPPKPRGILPVSRSDLSDFMSEKHAGQNM